MCKGQGRGGICTVSHQATAQLTSAITILNRPPPSYQQDSMISPPALDKGWGPFNMCKPGFDPSRYTCQGIQVENLSHTSFDFLLEAWRQYCSTVTHAGAVVTTRRRVHRRFE